MITGEVLGWFSDRHLAATVSCLFMYVVHSFIFYLWHTPTLALSDLIHPIHMSH